MLIYIAAAIAGTVLLCIAAGLIKQRLRLRSDIKDVVLVKNKASLRELLKRAEQGDAVAHEELVSNARWMSVSTDAEGYSTDLTHRLRAITVPFKKAKLYSERQDRLDDFIAAWREAIADIPGDFEAALEVMEPTKKLIDHLKSTWHDYPEQREQLLEEAGLTLEQCRESLQSQIDAAYHLVVGNIEASREAFIIMRTLQHDGVLYGTGYRGGHAYYGKRNPYPECWNELAARYLESPVVQDFVETGDFHQGVMRLRAAQAVAAKDFTMAKIVLAYCNYNDGYRQEVGEVLLADLAKLVVAMKADVGATYA